MHKSFLTKMPSYGLYLKTQAGWSEKNGRIEDEHAPKPSFTLVIGGREIPRSDDNLD